VSVEAHFALGRIEKAGDHVEQRRLARTVRSDDRCDGVAADRKRDALVRPQAAEAHADVVDGELHRLHTLCRAIVRLRAHRLRSRVASPTRPRGSSVSSTMTRPPSTSPYAFVI